MYSDPIVAEIGAIREEFAARFGYDLNAIFKYAQQRDAEGDRKIIRLPPRPPTIISAKSRQVADADSNRS